MAKSIHDLISDRFGVRVRSDTDPVVAQVGVAATRVLINNGQRYSFTMVNLSAAVIFLKPAQDVSATSGIRLSANGGQVSVTVEDDFVLPALEWWALATAAAAEILIIAVIGEPD